MVLLFVFCFLLHTRAPSSCKYGLELRSEALARMTLLNSDNPRSYRLFEETMPSNVKSYVYHDVIKDSTSQSDLLQDKFSSRRHLILPSHNSLLTKNNLNQRVTGRASMMVFTSVRAFFRSTQDAILSTTPHARLSTASEPKDFDAILKRMIREVKFYGEAVSTLYTSCPPYHLSQRIPAPHNRPLH